MLIQDYKRIDGWLNVRINPDEGDCLYDFDGVYHSISEAEELYNQYKNLQKQDSNLRPMD